MRVVGVYARGKREEVESQLAELRRYSEEQSWQITEFIDYESGGHAHRQAFQNLFVAASRREINVALVWSLDRFSRDGVGETFGHIKKLAEYGCQFESLTEHARTGRVNRACEVACITSRTHYRKLQSDRRAHLARSSAGECQV